MTEDELRAELKHAKDLLREWRDKYGGKENHKFTGWGAMSASPTDLLRDTNKLLEVK